MSNTGSHQYLGLDNSRDWIVNLPRTPVQGGIDIDGGHNVIIIGGEIDLTTPCTSDSSPCHGIFISRGPASTGEVYIEGVLIRNPDPTHSRYTGDGIDVYTFTTSTITLQNIRVEGVDGCGANGFPAHADIFQPYGARGAVIQVDHFTGSSDFQGFEIDPTNVGTPARGDYRNINLIGLPNPHACAGWNGDLYLWWLTAWNNSCTTYPVTMTNVWVREPNGSLANHAVWPDTFTTFGCGAVYAGGAATWPRLPAIGAVLNGTPPGGDFVPAGVAGINYVSPGYR